MIDKSYWIGLDLGQAKDPTAGVVLQRICAQSTPAEPDPLPVYTGIWLQRWPLGTKYPVIVSNVKTLCDQIPRLDLYEYQKEVVKAKAENKILPAHIPRYPNLIVDQTGVGRAVVDILTEAQPKAIMQSVQITGGFTIKRGGFGEWNVPKKELVGAVSVLLQSRRLKFIRSLRDLPLLIDELTNFKFKIQDSGNVEFSCLTAGTMIETSAGNIPIEKVERGHDVLTREGYNRVLWSGETKRVYETCRVSFDNGETLEGTPDHLIWTINRGWTELGDLQCSDLISSATVMPSILLQKPSCSTDSNTESRLVSATTSTRKLKTRCTKRYGRKSTVQFPLDTIFITSTTMQRTTTSVISNCLQTPNTPLNISRSTHRILGDVQLATTSLSADENALQTTAIQETRSVPCGAPTSDAQRGKLSAKNVARSSCPTPLQSIAVSNAEKLTDTSTTTIQSRNASSVRSHSSPRESHISFVRVLAPPRIVRYSEKQPVYDLVVENCHEFYANGILAHNSWRERDFDDIVLAVAMACFMGETIGGAGSMQIQTEPKKDGPEGLRPYKGSAQQHQFGRRER